MGGSDNDDNLVRLSLEEHILAHKLLPQFVPVEFRGKLWFALHRMMTGRQGKLLGMSEEARVEFKEQFIEACRVSSTGRLATQAQKAARSEYMKSNPVILSDDARLSIAESCKSRFTGKAKDESHRSKISAALVGIKRENAHNRDPDKIAKAAASNRGQTRSNESKQRMSEAKLGKPTWNKGISNTSAKGRFWVHNPESTQEKMVRVQEDGWVRGRLRKTEQT